MKKTFTFSVNYFKESGKWYTETQWQCECTALCNDQSQPYMYDALDKLKELRDKGQLPGLHSGKWDSYIMFQYEDSYPTLIVPSK